MSKWGTFGHILEGIGSVADPRIAQAIKAGHAIHDATTGRDRVAPIEDAIEASLSVAGDISGKAALSDPALAALTKKYIEDGIALHDYIEAHKKANVVASDSDLGVHAGSTGH